MAMAGSGAILQAAGVILRLSRVFVDWLSLFSLSLQGLSALRRRGCSNMLYTAAEASRLQLFSGNPQLARLM